MTAQEPHKEKPQRVRIMPMKRLTPLPLPPVASIREKMRQHPLAVNLAEHTFHEWFTTPLNGDTWSRWGCAAQMGPDGLTFDRINNVSGAAEPSDRGYARLRHTRYVTLHPGITPELSERIAPKQAPERELDRKYLAWADDAGKLAEEAMARQWRPGLTVRWDEMECLSPQMERAFDQFATYLIQAQQFCSDAMGPFIGRVHYQFMEVKTLMACELFDYNLHCAMLRKRVMSNGGGMGQQVDGFDAGVLEVCNEASQGFEGFQQRDLTGMTLALDVLFNGVVLDFLRLAESAHVSSFDRRFFRQMQQDTARHVAWGCRRVKYHLEHAPDREDVVLRLDCIAEQAEAGQAAGHLLNPQVIEPLAVLLGGAPEKAGEGYAILRRFWPQFAGNYLARLDAAGLPRRGRSLIPEQPPF
ncbi:MAG: hypothetical protein EXR49_08850 [Dehalococcoidia bacterium]|nr:hypothetical protein [Dehalococcoidia bacterium]